MECNNETQLKQRLNVDMDGRKKKMKGDMKDDICKAIKMGVYVVSEVYFLIKLRKRVIGKGSEGRFVLKKCELAQNR